MKESEDIEFNACYEMNADPLVNEAQHIRMTVDEIWKITGY